MKRPVKAAIGILALAGVAIAMVGVLDSLRLRQYRQALAGEDLKARMWALGQIIDRRERRVAEQVFEVVRSESDPELLSSAGLAAVRIQDPSGARVLQERADSLPDSPLRCRLIIYAAKLSGRDLRLRDWLGGHAGGGSGWTRVGAALGLLELGSPEGGKVLLDAVGQLETPALEFAATEFRRICDPMTQAVGQPLAGWPDLGRRTPDDPAWQHLRSFWDQYGHAELLAASLDRLERSDLKWHEVDRLLHARPRAERWLD